MPMWNSLEILIFADKSVYALVELCSWHMRSSSTKIPHTGNVGGGAGWCHRKRKRETRFQYFLEIDPLDRCFVEVTANRLDPSCSGPGIISTPDRANDAEAGAEGFGDEGERGGRER